MRAIQPYFALSASKYYKRELTKHGISHIYEYKSDLSLDLHTLVVPDASIDILFDLTDYSYKPYAAGSVLQSTAIDTKKDHKYFGVRFVPGVVPDFLDGRFKDFLDNTIELEACLRKRDLIDKLNDAKTFLNKVEVFLNFYNDKNKPAWKNSSYDIYSYARKCINNSKGLIRVNELESELNYSVRYINKLFNEYCGLSPKAYSNIIRFQTTLDQLNREPNNSFTSISEAHGYYDQAQFIREFKKFTTKTPAVYRKLVNTSNYSDKFIFQ